MSVSARTLTPKTKVVLSAVTSFDLPSICEPEMEATANDPITDLITPVHLRPPHDLRVVRAVTRLQEDLNNASNMEIKACLEDTGEIVGFAK
ncbi:unnamed protein product [Didymodactylos carnosus]|uniref:Uncharacterized protein n=1 Tax=Didymodactylos carnosus TaxID=1234261 RepID=A0A815WGD6_9BILA|nr:unnamed protein product [Didymodactylos carnosus]CAF4408240.1 unnamed protein product [Didymodactylos carnosus]